MIKRLAKSKKSKKGAILVIVVLILALAMIFIASAMMLTQATRRRLYSTAYQSQARLTVTAASEVFLEALKMQEITDTQIEAIMGQTHGDGNTKVKMVVDNVPGMSEAADNCTYLDIYQDPTNSDIVYCDFTTIIGESTENVQVVLKAEESDPSYGSQFKNQVEVAGGVGAGELRFTGGVGMWDPDEISRPTDNNIVLRGNYKGVTSSSIYVSDVVFGQDSNNVQLGGGENFSGRVIFLQGAQMNARSNANILGDIYLIGTDNSAGMALKDENQPGVWDTVAKTSNAIVFSGRKIQNDPGLSKNKQKIEQAVDNGKHSVYFLDSTGKSLGLSSNNAKGIAGDHDYTITKNDAGSDTSTYAPTDIKNNVTRYQGWNYKQSEKPFPTASGVFKTLCPDGQIGTGDGSITLDYDTYTPSGEFLEHGKAIPNGKKYIKNPVTTSYPSYRKDADGKCEKYLYLDQEKTSRYLEPGYYYITSSGITTSGSKIEGGGQEYRYDPIVFTIDGAEGQNYRFYFQGDRNFVLRGVVFAIYNADASKPVYFILEDKAKVQLSHNNDGLWENGVNNRPNLCAAGFLSVPNRTNSDDSAAYITQIKTQNWTSEKHKVKNTEYKTTVNGNVNDDASNLKTVELEYSECYDNKVRPAMFIFGVGNNVLCLGKSVTIEAYIGLYGGSSFGPIDGSGDKQTIYGRIECQEFHTYDNEEKFIAKVATGNNSNPVGDFCMPYCPQPVKDTTIPKQRLAKSKYSVVDIIYYYEGETTESS